MQTGLPPELGTLVGVVPVASSLRRGPWTMTLVSVERWSTCLVASFDVLCARPGDRMDLAHPSLDVEATDDRGVRYDGWFGGGYGGGLRDGGHRSRIICKFTPPLAASVDRLLVRGRLALKRQEIGPPPRQVVSREDPEPWVFAVALTETPPGRGRDDGGSATSPPTSPRREPPELRRLRRVIPVVREASLADWRVTFVAVESYDDGFRLVFRLYGAGKAAATPDLKLRVGDDNGNDYAAWGGGGTGEPTLGACHWRQSYNCAPSLDAGRALHVHIDEVRTTVFEPVPGDPARGRLAPGEATAGNCSFTVAVK